MAHIFIVEDDPSIVKNLSEYLHGEGFKTTSAAGQKEALRILKENGESFDLILLDVSLSDGNGFAVCAKVKADMDLPVIFLTASGDEYSVVTGLDIGADDYIAKPFKPRELVSRINSVLRRYHKASSSLSYQGLVIDTQRARLTKNGEEVILSALEYRLLLYFFKNKGVALSRNAILDELWDIAGEFVNDNTLTVYIKRLREKIEDDPSNPVYVKTLRGIGYKFGD